MKNILIYLSLFLISFQSFSQVNNVFQKKKSVKIKKITELNKDLVSDGTLGDEIDNFNCSGVITQTDFFTVNDKDYLFC